jgi:hypothetical protein
MDAVNPLITPTQEETPESTLRPVPDETVTSMPVQDLKRWDTNRRV